MKVKTCVHYVAGKVEKTEKATVLKVKAYSLLKPCSNNFICKNCGCVLGNKEKQKIDEIVDYLNSGGCDEKRLSKLYQGIRPVDVQYGLFGKVLFTNELGVSKNFVPEKNDIE